MLNDTPPENSYSPLQAGGVSTEFSALRAPATRRSSRSSSPKQLVSSMIFVSKPNKLRGIRLAQNKTKLALLILLFATLGASAINGHRIKNLNVTITPAKPRIGDSITVKAEFDLKSSTGFDTGRLKAFFNAVNGKPLTGTFNIRSITDDIANVGFNGSNSFQISAEKTNIIFQYWLTRTQVNSDPPQAQSSTSITARPALTTNNNSGGGNGGGNSGGNSTNNNGDPITVPQAFFLSVSEDSNGDTGSVSDIEKRFVLRVSHDQDYISFVSSAFFDPSLDPILSNLVIKSNNTENGIVSKITPDFSFTVDSDSVVDANRENYLLTDYTSNLMSVREAQRLNFTVNLATHFENTQITLPGNLIVKDNVKYRIKPLGIPLTDITISPSTLSFSQDLVNAKRNKQLLLLDEATITANLTTSTDLSGAFVTSSDLNKNKKARIKLSDSKKPKQKISPNLDGNGAFSITTIDAVNGNYQISFPINAAISTSQNTFVKNKVPLTTSATKNILIPIEINMESAITNGLDLILEGTLAQDTLIDIEVLETSTSELQ